MCIRDRVSNFCSQADIKKAIDKADRKAAKKIKQVEKENKKLETNN